MNDDGFITDSLCRLCNIYYRDAYHKKRHENTKKHKQKLFHKEKQSQHNISIERHVCHDCGKSYKYLSGLSKHQAKYHQHLNEQNNKNKLIKNSKETTPNNEMMMIMKEILKTQLNILSKQQEQQNQSIEQQNIFNNQGIYINKSVVNVNVFLNEYCNNAISLMDFINNLNLTLDDLKETKSLGYVNGVSNILVKKLVSLKPTERPIHCDNSNKNDFDFYVKDETNWMKDIDNKKIDWSIENISKKQIEMLQLWEKAHPNWMNSDKETETYLEMVKLCMGGSSPDEIEKNKQDIKKALANGVKIEDIMNIVQ
jgi:hypothetical protein